MAAKEHGHFWNSRNKDRVYDADSFGEWARTFFTTGVFINTNYVRAAGGLSITIDAGYSNVNGKVGIFDTADTLTLAAPHASLRRIDTVVIERNDVDREFYRKIVQGNPAANPVAPAPVRDNGIYQLVLAQITVAAGATSITQGAIRDTRADSNLCGYVAGTAKELSWEQITAQWNTYYEEFKASQFADFDEWFNHMKDQLTTDAAGNLQTQIDAMNADVENAVTSIKNLLSQKRLISEGQSYNYKLYYKYNNINLLTTEFRRRLSSDTWEYLDEIFASTDGYVFTSGPISANGNGKAMKLFCNIKVFITKELHHEECVFDFLFDATDLLTKKVIGQMYTEYFYIHGRFVTTTSPPMAGGSKVPFRLTIEDNRRSLSNDNGVVYVDIKATLKGSATIYDLYNKPLQQSFSPSTALSPLGDYDDSSIRMTAGLIEIWE